MAFSSGNLNALGRSRTCNPRFRRPMLYPIELRVLDAFHCKSPAQDWEISSLNTLFYYSIYAGGGTSWGCTGSVMVSLGGVAGIGVGSANSSSICSKYTSSMSVASTSRRIK
jgi:hypothetical protein